MKRILVVLALAGCGVDSFYSIPPLGDDGAETDGAALEGSAGDDGGAELDASLEAAVDAAQNDAGMLDAPAADAPAPCPTIGGSCSPVGLRKCRALQIVWYCSGTWSSNACTQGNPACSPCDAGMCCTIGPVCP